MASVAVSDEEALRMRPTPCGCTSARRSGIPEMSRTKTHCQLSATVCGTLARTISYRKCSNPAPEQGVKENLRVSAINRSPAPLFAHFFGQDRKSGSPKARLRPQRKSGSSVKPDKRADVGIRSYRVRRKSPSGGTASPPAEYAEMRCGCFPHERECEYET